MPLNNQELRVAINTSTRYTSQLITIAIYFFLTPYLVSKLGATMLGLQVLSMQVVQFSLLCNSALSTGYSRYAMVSYSQGDYARMNELLGHGLVMTGLLMLPSLSMVFGSAIFADVFFGLSGRIANYGRIIILVSGSATILGMFINVWETGTFLIERFYIREIGSVFSNLISAAGVIILFSFTEPSIITWIVLSSCTALVVRCFVVIPWSLHYLPQMKIYPQFKAIKESRAMLTFSLASFLGSLGYLLYYATDSIIISNLKELGPDKIFPYSIGQRWDPFIRQILLSFLSALQPTMIGLFAAKHHMTLKRVLFRATRYAMLVGLLPCLIFFAFSNPFIRLWVGDAFVADSAPVMRCLLISVALSLPTIAGYEMLLAAAKIKQAVVATIAGGIINMILSIVLVKYAGLGLLGVAFGTMLTLSIKNSVYMPWLISRKLGVNLVEYIRATYLRPFLCILPSIFAALFFQLWPEPATWTLLLIQMAVCTSIYSCMVWAVGLSHEDRKKVVLFFNHASTLARRIILIYGF